MRIGRFILAIAVLVALSGCVRLALPAAGRWLVVEDPLEKSRAVVVLGGQVPFRAIEAAAIYRQGLVKQVWLTQGAYSAEDEALTGLGVERTPEFEYSRRVLVRLGVPATGIEVLGGHNESTADEVNTIASRLRSEGAKSVIIVSSRFHGRRIQVLWGMLVGNSPRAIVRYATGDPFDASAWWLTTGDSMSVAREYAAILNGWLGFPLRSHHGSS